MAEEKPVVVVEGGCKKCGEKKHYIATSDGTPQPEPFLPLLNLTFTCTKCGNIWEAKDTYVEKHEMNMGPDVVTEEIPVTFAHLPSEEDIAALKKAFGSLQCAVCGKGSVLPICTKCLRRGRS